MGLTLLLVFGACDLVRQLLHRSSQIQREHSCRRNVVEQNTRSGIMPITPRHFLVDTDLTPAEQAEVLNLAQIMKADPYEYKPLAGPQSGIVMFDKSSTRTRDLFASVLAALLGSPLIISVVVS